MGITDHSKWESSVPMFKSGAAFLLHTLCNSQGYQEDDPEESCCFLLGSCCKLFAMSCKATGRKAMRPWAQIAPLHHVVSGSKSKKQSWKKFLQKICGASKDRPWHPGILKDQHPDHFPPNHHKDLKAFNTMALSLYDGSLSATSNACGEKGWFAMRGVEISGSGSIKQRPEQRNPPTPLWR